MMTQYITWISAIIIGMIFGYFIFQSCKMIICRMLLDEATNSEDLLKALDGSKLSKLKDKYQKNINIDIVDGQKTNLLASEIFSEQTVSKMFRWNLRMLDAASGTLVGLGLLGTFLGLTIGIEGFDSSDTTYIQNSIQSLLAGMGTAFYTSLVGMGSSLVYTGLEKRWKNKLAKSLFLFTEKLDEQYYIDDISLLHYNQKALFNEFWFNVEASIKQQSNTVIAALEKQLTYRNENGDIVVVGNAIREILKENTEQSKALKSFSTDLAIELNNGFDEVLSRQMQEKLIPLMENIDDTTKAVVEHIDQMSASVASPATDMIQNVVDELKNSMTLIMREFKNNLSGDATHELEELASSLGTATQAMADFPKNMENISVMLQVTIEEVKNAISEISNTSAAGNDMAMRQMQEQITLATTSIGNAITEVKEVMSTITRSSEQSSQNLISKLAIASEQMGQFMSDTMGQLSLSLKESVRGITDDVTNKQSDLLALQENTVGETEKLLNVFNQGLDRMERMNEYVTGTMDMFQKAQGEITGSTAHLKTITSDMKVATEVFNKGQNDHVAKLAQLQTSSQHGIDQVTELLKNSGYLSEEYVQKFDIIKQGLGSIFAQLQNGLSEYSRTVKDTTDRYLEQYASSMTQSTGALASAIERQNEATEMLNETIARNKR